MRTRAPVLRDRPAERSGGASLFVRATGVAGGPLDVTWSRSGGW